MQVFVVKLLHDSRRMNHWTVCLSSRCFIFCTFQCVNFNPTECSKDSEHPECKEDPMQIEQSLLGFCANLESCLHNLTNRPPQRYIYIHGARTPSERSELSLPTRVVGVRLGKVKGWLCWQFWPAAASLSCQLDSHLLKHTAQTSWQSIRASMGAANIPA